MHIYDILREGNYHFEALIYLLRTKRNARAKAVSYYLNLYVYLMLLS